jgi:hypothetical protein
MPCFVHKKVNQHAVLTDGAGNFLIYQEAEICTKCGKVFSQRVMKWDVASGWYEEVN